MIQGHSVKMKEEFISFSQNDHFQELYPGYSVPTTPSRLEDLAEPKDAISHSFFHHLTRHPPGLSTILPPSLQSHLDDSCVLLRIFASILQRLGVKEST